MTLVLGTVVILFVLWETFETIILPRRVRRRFRLTRLYYSSSWTAWVTLVRRIPRKKRREALLSFFGPISLLGLLALWAGGLVLGFALVHSGSSSELKTVSEPPSFSIYLYFSGTTFFTLGLGDITPVNRLARALTTLEAGVGFGFLAIVIGYLPVIYQAFSRREVIISMLDARAGSPPTAVELLRRHAKDRSLESLDELLRDWEQWSAELLESHLSYPVLAYFRSQHTNQSWLAALTAILDTCALIIAGVNDGPTRQAQLTFAMARHAVADLAQIFARSRQPVLAPDRLPPTSLSALRDMLGKA